MGFEITYNPKDDQCVVIGKQGTTWQFTVKLYQDEAQTIPMDLTGYTARGQIRKSYTDTNIIATFDCVINNNEVTCSLSPTVTATIPAYPKNVSIKSLPKWEEGVNGCYVFDIEIDNNAGYVERIVEGILFVDPEVTK
jgi:hypothetical protein